MTKEFRRNTIIGVVLIFLVQLGFLLKVGFEPQHIRAEGKELVIEAQTVDPYDPFYGRYVILQYPFNDVTENTYIGKGKFDDTQKGDTVYLHFEENEPFAKWIGWSEEPIKKNGVYNIRALVEGNTPLFEKQNATMKAFQLNHGLDRFFIDERNDKFDVATWDWDGTTKYNVVLRVLDEKAVIEDVVIQK